MNNKKGFTIIELIVVIAIIAVLAGIVLVNVNGYIVKARNVKRNADIGSYVKSLAAYFVDNGEYPVTDEAGYCCLGSDTNNCWDGSYPQCVNVNNALEKYLSGLPSGVAPVNTTSGSNLNGYLWHSGKYLLWALEGARQSCGVGVVSSADNFGVTTCAYYFQQ